MSHAELCHARPSPRRLRRRTFDPALLLWIVLAAALIFLVVNPLFRLVQLSLQDTDTGAFTLLNYVTAYSRPALPRRDVELAATRLLGHRAVPDLRGAGRLGGVAHRHAVQGRDPPADAGRVRHAALSRFDRLDPAGRAELRLAEPRMDGADRRAGRACSTSIRSRAWRSTSRSTRSPICSSSPPPRSTWCRRRWRTPPTSSAPARCAPRCASRCRWCCRQSSAAPSSPSWKRSRCSARRR